MRIILLKDVKSIGSAGETHEVADGYAQHLLFPKHLAVPATQGALDDVAAAAEAERRAAERELRELQRLAAALDGFELIMVAAANAEGTLYGAVSAASVTDALVHAGKHVIASWVMLEDSIKELGEYDVRIEMPHGLEATVRIIVEHAP